VKDKKIVSREIIFRDSRSLNVSKIFFSSYAPCDARRLRSFY